MTWPGILGWTVSLLAFIKAQLVILLLRVLSAGPIPRHVAFEMDGNRRFARLTGRRAVDGHSDGFHTLKQILETCMRLNIHCVTVYAFAIENFNRPPDEVDALMKLAEERLVEIAQNGALLSQYGVRLNVLGHRKLLPVHVQVAIDKAEGMTRQNNRAILNVCAPYASRHEMTLAVQTVVQQALDKENFDSSLITEQIIEENLMTSLGGSPPLDIFIRTSGVKRLSGFLQWQCCENTQIHMVNTYWPDFGLWDFVPILLDYQRKVWAQSSN
ncbi:Decaprenyl diphosphate synthase-like protein [Suillus plorans]|uniref:Alkyl transferase n=1 Tax=Suillus plorans TaxID=116603 RepID=A0A9P7AIR2_9AGAM|nr:Decaprenyl diphosphate synthase-like protein [Suillus plorans]KAG1790295.1 Decaprenyl diphosphate synthase-like protein [Suillus plorans]